LTDATKLIDDFAKAGATLISIHLEAEHDLRACLQQIRKLDCKAGLVLNPDTLIDAAAPYLADIDMLLIMSVYPGFAAQGFLPSSIERLQEARALIDDSNLPIRLEIDGGIKLENVAAAVSAGADTIVAGSAIFGTNDYPQTISAFQKEIQTADLA
jgi:ribulose-phosphate 3-epimerase